MHNQQKSIGTFLAVTAPNIRLAQALIGLEHHHKRCLAYSDDSKSKPAERSRVNGDIFDLRLPKNAPVVGTSSTTSTATPTPHPFEKRVPGVKVSKDDMNAFIMDYLVSVGYPASAAKFAKEANIQPRVGVDTIKERLEVRDLIYKEDILSAIEKINDLDPLLLDQDASLHFALLRLQLVKLIRDCMATAPNDDDEFMIAQQFAETHLGPRAPSTPETLNDLECTMLLLLFPADKPIPDKLKHILDPLLREKVAERVNEALLQRSGEPSHSRLSDMVRLRVWSENKARQSKIDLPDHIDIGLDPHSTVQNGHNGMHEEALHANGDSEPMAT